MIANTLVSSRMSYWARVLMPIPKRINENLDSDMQALVWNKENDIDAEEEGTKKQHKRFMREQYDSAKER